MRLARQARSMSQTELAGLTDLSQTLISMLEDDVRRPSAEQVDLISSALHLPPSFFIQSDLVLGTGLGEVFHRKRKTIPVKELDMIHAWLNLSRFAIRRMVSSVTWLTTTLPIWEDDLDDRSIVDAANLWRASLRLPSGPIRNVSDSLDRSGVMLVPMPYATPKIDAVGQWIPGLPPVIFVNPDVPQDRLRFTLMHEIGHFVLHSNPYSLLLSEEIERQADLFAGAALMPADEISADLWNPDMRRLASLKRVWKVSMQALLMRARQLGQIDAQRERELWREFSRNGWRTREPKELDVVGEEPFRRFSELTKLYTQQRGYSMHDLAKMVHLGPEDIIRITASAIQGLRLV